MNIIISTLYIFLEIIYWIVILDVILSWLMLFWLKIRPKILADIIDPMYKKIRDFIPTKIWPLDLTPIVAIILITFLMWVLTIISK